MKRVRRENELSGAQVVTNHRSSMQRVLGKVNIKSLAITAVKSETLNVTDFM